MLGRGEWNPKRQYVDIVSIEVPINGMTYMTEKHLIRVRRRLCAADGDRFFHWVDVKPGDVEVW